MKKLNKLQINSEKLMNNEELIRLRGGYSPHDAPCYYDCKGSSSTCYGPCPRCECNVPGAPGICICTSP